MIIMLKILSGTRIIKLIEYVKFLFVCLDYEFEMKWNF